MLIDWFTVGAQALNFLILVWLMKRFLYKPILQAIDTREKLIAGELKDAAAKKAEAKAEKEEFEGKNTAFNQERAKLLSTATSEAEAEKQKLISQARQAADILQGKRMETLLAEAQSLSQSISRLTQKEVFAITRKTLADLADISLEEQICLVFLKRLSAMDGKSKEVLGQALKTATAPAVVRSTFALPEKERGAIQKALNETFSADIHLCYETTSDLVCGIELSSSGQKLEWSIANYLVLIEKEVTELLKKQLPPEPLKDLLPQTKTGPLTETKMTAKQKDSEHAA
jgi:F-type H+-transporting ATPase subunit b